MLDFGNGFKLINHMSSDEAKICIFSKPTQVGPLGDTPTLNQIQECFGNASYINIKANISCVSKNSVNAISKMAEQIAEENENFLNKIYETMQSFISSMSEKLVSMGIEQIEKYNNIFINLNALTGKLVDILKITDLATRSGKVYFILNDFLKEFNNQYGIFIKVEQALAMLKENYDFTLFCSEAHPSTKYCVFSHYLYHKSAK